MRILSRKIYSVWLFVFFFLIPCSLVNAVEAETSSAASEPVSPSPIEVSPPVSNALIATYAGIYRSGSLPFKAKTKLRIDQFGSSFVFQTEKENKKVPAFKLSVEMIRGAELSAEGVWIYWFDDSGNTLCSFIEMAEGNTALAGAVNTMTLDYNQAPLRQQEKYKATYEVYKEEALKEAK